MVLGVVPGVVLAANNQSDKSPSFSSISSRPSGGIIGVVAVVVVTGVATEVVVVVEAADKTAVDVGKTIGSSGTSSTGWEGRACTGFASGFVLAFFPFPVVAAVFLGRFAACFFFSGTGGGGGSGLAWITDEFSVSEGCGGCGGCLDFLGARVVVVSLLRFVWRFFFVSCALVSGVSVLVSLSENYS